MTLEHRETRGVNLYSVLNRRCPRRRRPSFLGPFYTYPDIFESAILSFRIRLPSTRIWRIRQRIRIFLNPLSRVEKNKSATNQITGGRVNPDIFEPDDVANSCPVSYRTINQYGGTTATTEHICRHCRALHFTKVTSAVHASCE